MVRPHDHDRGAASRPGAFTLGTLSYDASTLTGTGLEVLDVSTITLSVSRQDFSFNALGESTEPGTWVGYPCFYWGIDNAYTLGVRDLEGPAFSGRAIGRYRAEGGRRGEGVGRRRHVDRLAADHRGGLRL